MADSMSLMDESRVTYWEEGALKHFMDLIQLLNTPSATVDADIKGAVSSMAVAAAFAQMNIPERLDVNSTPRFVDDTQNGIEVDVTEYVYDISNDGTKALDIRFVPWENLSLDKTQNNEKNIMRPYFAGQRFTLKADSGTESQTTLFTYFPHHISLDDKYSYTMLWRDVILSKRVGKYILNIGELRRSYINSKTNTDSSSDEDASLETNRMRVDYICSDIEYEKGKLAALEIYKMPFNMVS